MSGRQSYETLVRPHLDDLLRYCYYLTRSKWDGEDLYQDVLLKSMVYFVTAEPYRDIMPFLRRVATNLWIDDCRAKQRRLRISIREFVVYHTDSDYGEVRSLIEWMGQRLPSRNVEMLLLSNYFGYTMQEIADLLGCTVSAVKSLLHRTRKQLREQRDQMHDNSGWGRTRLLDVESWSRAVMKDLPPHGGLFL